MREGGAMIPARWRVRRAADRGGEGRGGSRLGGTGSGPCGDARGERTAARKIAEGLWETSGKAAASASG